MIGRLLRKSDFERLLAVAACSRSAHFAMHHVRARPAAAGAAAREELCTGDSLLMAESVDNLRGTWWLGSVLPKRHAPRAVTRNMLRRQIRAAMQRHLDGLPPGMWLVRLRQPFARPQFASADSGPLRAVAAAELDRLFQRAAA